MPLGKPRKQQDVAFALMVSLGMEAVAGEQPYNALTGR
jgi:hypothetical protein